MKEFFDKLICKLFGHKPDRIDHRGICSDYICVRCWYYHEGIKWPHPPPKKTNTKRIAEILLSTKGQEMSAAQKEAQRESFAYGNTYIENNEITREVVKEASQKVPQHWLELERKLNK